MLRATIGRWMICVGLSDILYLGGTLGENSCIMCTYLLLLYISTVTLHSIRMIFTLMIFIGTFDSCHCRDSSTRFDENLSEPMLRFCKIYPIGAFDLISHRIIVGVNNQNSGTFYPSCFSYHENIKFHVSDTTLCHSSILQECQFAWHNKTCCLLNLYWLEYSTFQNPSDRIHNRRHSNLSGK